MSGAQFAQEEHRMSLFQSHISKLEIQLRRLGEEIDAFVTQAHAADAPTKTDDREGIHALRVRQRGVAAALAALKESAFLKWGVIREGARTARTLIEFRTLAAAS
jgi:hypothetical protein